MRVQVVRLSRKDNPLDNYAYEIQGELVDSRGRTIPKPVMGQPLFIKTMASRPTWDFCTGLVEQVHEADDGWLVFTHGNNAYTIMKLDETS